MTASRLSVRWAAGVAGAGAVVAAVLVAGCASGSRGNIAQIESDTIVTETVRIDTDSNAETDQPAITDRSPSSASIDGESDPSLPANIWPEDFAEPGESPDSAEAEVSGVADKEVVTRATEGGVAGVVPEGVGSVTARVTSPDGEVCEVCLWLADDDPTRQRGLMGVTDLGGAVGMAFRWEQRRTGHFFMFQTPTPISIAWFDEGGEHVGQADMEPCLVEDSAVCERYAADAPYVLAIEMFGGQLDRVGIGPESHVELLDWPCV